MIRPRTPLPTLEWLRSNLSYDPVSGDIVWASHRFSRLIGKDATTRRPNRVSVRTRGAEYTASRVAWKIFYGVEPPDFVDHINGDWSDNRISNLRAATCMQNSANRRASTKSKSGLKGASWHAKCRKWQAGLSTGNRFIHLGLFDTPEEAHEAYWEFAKKRYGQFARKQ